MIRMFYNTDAEPVGAGSVNVASLMATQGIKTGGSETDTGVIPDIKTKSEPTVPVEPSSAAPADSTLAKPGSAAGPGAEANAPEGSTETTKSNVQQVLPDWKELIKKQAEADVLQQLGYDGKIASFLSNWKSGGDVGKYLEALSTDYSKMSAEDVMRCQLRLDYPELSEEDFEEYYRMKVTEHYKLDKDLFTETDIKRGNILLNADAKRIRQALIDKQQEFLLPKAPEQPIVDKEAEKMAEQKAAQESLDAYKNLVHSDPYVKEVVKNKLLAVGQGDERFNYETQDPARLLNLLYDGNAWKSKLQNEDGTPNIQKQLLIAAIVEDEKLFLNEFAKHYKTLGAKNAIDPIENASSVVGTPSKGSVGPMSPAEALARAGVIVSG